MNRDALLAFPLDERIRQEESGILRDLRPIFRDLLAKLAAMPDSVPKEQLLSAFRDAISQVNEFADEIETVERETILNIVYEIGAIVGLPANSQFAEEWRGDW